MKSGILACDYLVTITPVTGFPFATAFVEVDVHFGNMFPLNMEEQGIHMLLLGSKL